MSLLFGLFALAAYAGLIGGWILYKSEGLVGRFEAELAGPGEQERRGPVEALLHSVGRRGAPVLLNYLQGERREKVRRRLDAAGRPDGITVERYAERKAAFAILFSVLGLLLLIEGVWYSALPLILLGLIFEDLQIDGRARRRQAQIDKDLPDFLDVLAVCVNAGIAFRPAMGRVADAIAGPVGEEVQTTLRQLSLGASRREAFESLRARNPSDFVAAFVSAFLQAEELGVPLADALNDLARDMRRSAYQRARRRAQRAAPRVSLVVTTLIMPGAMLLIVAGMILGSDIHLGRIL